jgi:RNA polymerase sigma factor (sigma-70 family)
MKGWLSGSEGIAGVRDRGTVSGTGRLRIFWLRFPFVFAETGRVLPEARPRWGTAEDLAQEVMLTVYRKVRELRDHKLFRAWLFQVARHAACRYFAQRTREVPTVDVADIAEFVPARNRNPFGPAAEFHGWMKFLDARERETMEMRFVEEWQYHEIAAAQAVPIGTVQWRVFNSKKKLAAHLRPVRTLERQAA